MVKITSAEMGRLMRKNNLLTRQNAELEATLEYVAMMAGVELPEPEAEDEEDE